MGVINILVLFRLLAGYLLSLIYDHGHRPGMILGEQGHKADGSAAGYYYTIVNIPDSKGVIMKRSAGRKAHQPVYGIFHISFISILSFLVFSSPGYGSTDIPVNVNTTPAVIEAAALFAGFGIGAGLPSQGIFTTGNGNFGPTAASAFVVAFHDEEAVYTETLLDIEPLNGTILTAHPPCQDSCSL